MPSSIKPRLPPAPLESAIQSITESSIESHWVPICKDPELLAGRDATNPVAYHRTATHEAQKLRDLGLVPLGDEEDGERSFLQSFWWEPRFGADKTPVKSWNIVGMLPGNRLEDAGPRRVMTVVGHLDNLSAAEKHDYWVREGRSLTNYEGANDNAASVAAVQDIIRAVKGAGGLNSDLMVLITSAEEEGLKGSEAFAKAPPIPLDRISAVLNTEMLGFDECMVYGGANRQEARNNPLLARTLDVARENGYRVIDGLENEGSEGWWGRSDHLHFAKAGVPSVMLLGKPPNGQYHTEEDRIENADPARIRDGARLMLRTLESLDSDPRAQERTASLRPTVAGNFPGRVWSGNERPPGIVG